MTTKSTALLIIDAQNRIIGPCYQAAEVLNRIAELASRARQAGVPVIYVQDDDAGPEGSEDWAIHAAVAPVPGELVVRKKATDAFYGTALDQELKDRQIQQLIVAGARTEFCIDSACRRATTLGYNILLVADGHTTVDTPVLPAAQVIAHTNRVMDSLENLEYYGEVKPAAEIRFA